MPDIVQQLLMQNKRNLSIILVLACILYFSLVLFANPAKLFAAFSRLDPSSWLLIFSFSLTNYILRFARWHYYLGYLQHHIPPRQHFLYYMSGFALTLTPAKVGETIRSTYLAQHAVPYTHSLAMFFTERFLDIVVIALLSLFALHPELTKGGNGYHYFAYTSIFVTVSFIPLLRQTFVAQYIDFIRCRIPWKKLRTILQHLHHLMTSASALFAVKPVYTGLLIGAIAWVVQGFAFYFILTTLNIDITLQQSIGIYAVSLLAGALSFIPGGLGTTEAVMTLLLSLLGADTATAIAAALVSRLSTLWFAVSLGFIAATVLSFRKNG